jgi:pantoate kinase
MIRDRVSTTPVIDLTGPQGNAFYLMAQAGRYARRLGLDESAVVDEMKASDYENLVKVFDRYFGDYVILER